jgi:hypothetical protein
VEENNMGLWEKAHGIWPCFCIASRKKLTPLPLLLRREEVRIITEESDSLLPISTQTSKWEKIRILSLG